jgi:hypothetical protein
MPPQLRRVSLRQSPIAANLVQAAELERFPGIACDE